MLQYLGPEFLQELQDYYGYRLSKALNRGFNAEGSKFHWLYAELDTRAKLLRQAKLFMDALPKFMVGADEEKIFAYVVEYSQQILSDPAVNPPVGDGQPHPFFNNDNPYWTELQTTFENFEVGYNTSLLPMTYVDLCEYLICTLRLCLQMREQCVCAIDREKFDAVMHLRTTLAPTA